MFGNCYISFHDIMSFNVKKLEWFLIIHSDMTLFHFRNTQGRKGQQYLYCNTQSQPGRTSSNMVKSNESTNLNILMNIVQDDNNRMEQPLL